MLFKDLKPGYPVYILQKKMNQKHFKEKQSKFRILIFRLLLSAKCRL